MAIEHLWLDQKYTGLLSNRLEHFKVKKTNPYTVNFRCPFCGDSQKDKFKARGFVLEKKGVLRFYCHNCHANMKFRWFLRELAPELYNSYALERLAETPEQPAFVPQIESFGKRRHTKYQPLSELKTISALKHDHGAKKWVDARKIPPATHYKLYYCPAFYEWTNDQLPDKFDAKVLAYDEPRLILPFIDQSGYFYGYQGRSFKKDARLRYITIMLDESKPKIFGLDRVDFRKKYYLTEGPIDSLFLPNAIAAAGADANFDYFEHRENLVVVYDNEPRNKDIVRKIDNAIESGYQVVIWPQFIEQKDINDMVLAGHTAEQVKQIIDENTFKGMTAKIKLTQWKRVDLSRGTNGKKK